MCQWLSFDEFHRILFLDILGIVAAIFTIVSSLFVILTPFIVKAMKEKGAENAESHGEVRNVVNILLHSHLNIKNTSSASSSSGALSRDSLIINRVFDYARERHYSFKKNLLILILMSSLASLFNIILFLVLGDSAFLSSYIEFMTSDRYLYHSFSYVMVFITISMFYFAISYFFMLYFYERDLKNTLDNNIFSSKKRKIEELSAKISHDRSISNSNTFPSPALRRFSTNLGRERENKANKTRGKGNMLSEKTVLDDKPLKKPLLITIAANVLFLVFPGKVYDYFVSEIRVESLDFYKNNELVTTISNKEKIKLIPNILEKQGSVYFEFLHNDGKRYEIGFDLIEISEPLSSFTNYGQIINNTPLRYTPYEYSEVNYSLIQPSLGYGQEVKIHKSAIVNSYEEWVLVAIENNNEISQGFVNRKDLFIYSN